MGASAGEGREGTATDLDLVEYVVITTTALSDVGALAGALRSLVEGDQIRILDLVGVQTDALGGYTVSEPESLTGFADLEGEVGGLLSEDDVALACAALGPVASALILVAEDRWARPLAAAAAVGGGRVAGGERIPRHRLEQALRSRARRRPGG